MSSAAYRNFVNANAYRQKRNALYLDDPSMPTVNIDPSWDAFSGALDEREAAANAAGYNFRADLGGIGRGPGEGPMPGALNPLEAESQKRIAINRASDLDAQRVKHEQAAQDAYVDARGQQNVDDLRNSYAEHVDASLYAPPMEPSIITKDTTGTNPKYTVQSAAADPTERYLSRLPLPLRAKAEAQINAAKLETDKFREVQRHNKAVEDEKANTENADVAAAVTGMKEGTLPPQLPGRASKDYTKILAEAKRQGYDLASAATDWVATQKHVATMNGAQQLRLNQAVNQLPELLDSVEALAKKWDAGKFPILNKANLTLAKNGAFGREAASVATQLDAQLADVTADLGTVYMGGNSPTDHGLELAGKNLSGNWEKGVLLDGLDRARKNVQIRQNSIRNTGVMGASEHNPYVPNQGPAAAGKGGDPLGIR